MRNSSSEVRGASAATGESVGEAEAKTRESAEHGLGCLESMGGTACGWRHARPPGVAGGSE